MFLLSIIIGKLWFYLIYYKIVKPHEIWWASRRELWLGELFMTTVEAKKIPQRLAKYPCVFGLATTPPCTLYTRKILRTRALTCFMVVERRANKSLLCRASQWRREGALVPSNPPSTRGRTSIRVGCNFPRTGCSHRTVRFRYMHY